MIGANVLILSYQGFSRARLSRRHSGSVNLHHYLRLWPQDLKLTAKVTPPSEETFPVMGTVLDVF